MDKIRRILVPIDFSRDSERALESAIGLAKAFDAEIELLHSCEVTQIMSLYGVGYPGTLDAEIRAEARKQLAERRKKVEKQGIRAREHLTSAVPSKAIAEMARELEADLIVMGTRGQTGLPHVLLGSVAERTLRLAHCPVLTVKDQAAD